MDSRSPRSEKTAYLLILLLALGLRFISLGLPALTDSEAALALQALGIAQGADPALTSQVAYVNFTAVLFFIFGSTNFLARFWPALAGTALVFVPYLFRAQLKPRAAILLAGFIAIDPALVAFSRQVGSPIFAVTFFLLALAFWMRAQQRPAGLFLGLALLSGPSLWTGLIGLLLTRLFLLGFTPREKQTEESSMSESLNTEDELLNTEQHTLTASPLGNTENWSLNTDYRSLLTASALTILFASTLFLIVPQGLGAWLGSIPEFFKAQTAAPFLSVPMLFTVFAAYELLALLLAVMAMLRGAITTARRVIRLSMWTLVAFAVPLLYPAHLPDDLIWAVLPLLTLAALELSRHLQLPRTDVLETVGMAFFTVLLLFFAWLDFNALWYTPLSTAQGKLRIWLFAGSLFLLIVSAALVAYGWSPRIARVGLAWGAALVLGAFTLGAAWGATGLRNPLSVELWMTDAPIAQADLLAQTVKDISEWATGDPFDLKVIVYGVDSPALIWALRFHPVERVAGLDESSAPALVITLPQESLQLAASYRGQDFAWRKAPMWDQFSAFTLQWLTYHELPTQTDTLVLWARGDLSVGTQQSR